MIIQIISKDLVRLKTSSSEACPQKIEANDITLTIHPNGLDDWQDQYNNLWIGSRIDDNTYEIKHFIFSR